MKFSMFPNEWGGLTTNYLQNYNHRSDRHSDMQKHATLVIFW